MRNAAVLGLIGAMILLCLVGCSDRSSSDTAAASQTAQREQEAEDCLNVWLNTQASQEILDAGMQPTQDGGGSPALSPVLIDGNGAYRVNPSSPGFKGWIENNDVPWADIEVSILHGQGCPYVGPSAG